MSTNSCLTPQGVDLKWLEENLPHIPVNLLDDVVQIAHRHGVEAVGVFYNGIIELGKNSPRGTEYHEAFHAVFNSYLSEEQGNKILKETGKTEEQLANEFEDHYKFNIKPSSNVLTDFFNKIKFWIKEKLGLLKIHDLYSGLNSGYFKNKKPLNLVSNNAKFKEGGLPVKTGISELFEANPELTNIGTQQQYSKYLDTIFPDSKVKDIVYHGSQNKNIQQFSKDLIGTTRSGGKSRLSFGEGFYFSPDKLAAKEYAETDTDEGIQFTGKVYSVILNNPSVDLLPNNKPFQLVAFEPEQIHILSSKKDLEMFRNFIKFTKSEYVQHGDIQQFKDYIMSKNFAAVEEFLVVNNKIDRKC